MSNSLHPIERRILASLRDAGHLSFGSLVRDSRLDEDQVRRALQWLASKDLVSISESTTSELEIVSRPPELKLVEELRKMPAGASLDELRKKFGSETEFSAAFGRARTAGWVKVEGTGQQSVRTGDLGTLVLLETLIEEIGQGRDEHRLMDEMKAFLPDLLRRGLVRRVEHRTTDVAITEAGRSAVSVSVEAELLDRLTPEVIASGAWKSKKLRPLDVEAKSPVFHPGRRHPVRDFVREIREVYISMGFTELHGNSVYPAFWNFDALFIPQDHPGREMQDTFYLAGLSDPRLTRSGVIAKVASTHEDGWRTGSRGWGYKWRIEEARKLVLRTHNTVLTVRALSESKEKETRVFAVSKVYRNENLDYKHLAEFHHMDGIMVGKELNVRHLMGFLLEFYKKLGMKEVKLWPTYFPYTEPSLEVVGYSKATKSWIELSGSGVFRPEVTFPLGVRVPVLAWGPGVERLMLMRYGMDDMRALYGDDLSWLRSRRELAGS